MTKTHFKKMQNPNYLGSWDLYDTEGNLREIVLTVKEVKKEQVFDGTGKSENCPVMYFKESNFKPMVMNATNLKALAKITGSVFVEDWSGHHVKVVVKKVKAFGDIHDALRIAEEVIVPKLPELTPKHDKWNGAKEALKAKTVTIDGIKKKYSISAENEKLLLL